MATLSEIRTSLKTVLQNHFQGELFAYEHVEDMIELPAVIVEPIAASFHDAMQGGMCVWEFHVYVVVSRAIDTGMAHSNLDALVSGTGSTSLPQIINDHADLGLDKTEADCYALVGYGGSFDWAKIKHIGAVLRVRVLTDPR